MALNTFGGGGAAGFVGVPGIHETPGDTLAHWPLNGDTLDTVGTYHLDTGGTDNFAGLATGVQAYSSDAFVYDDTASTALNPNRNTDMKYTFATAIYIPTIVGNADIVRYEIPAATETAFRVGVVGSGGTVGQVFVGRDTSVGYQQYTTTALVTLDAWIHFAWTQAADGLSGGIYVNGNLLEAWSTANAPNSDHANSRFGIGASWSTVGYQTYRSAIVREKECTAGEILAMATQVGLL